jgi:UTP-glucose-1-phosphate uridylyltransferase
MKVFTVKGSGHYGGGMAIVCARSVVEAREVAATVRDTIWRTDWRNGEVTELEARSLSGPARVLDHFETGE